MGSDGKEVNESKNSILSIFGHMLLDFSFCYSHQSRFSSFMKCLVSSSKNMKGSQKSSKTDVIISEST